MNGTLPSWRPNSSLQAFPTSTLGPKLRGPVPARHQLQALRDRDVRWNLLRQYVSRNDSALRRSRTLHVAPRGPVYIKKRCPNNLLERSTLLRPRNHLAPVLLTCWYLCSSHGQSRIYQRPPGHVGAQDTACPHGCPGFPSLPGTWE